MCCTLSLVFPIPLVITVVIRKRGQAFWALWTLGQWSWHTAQLSRAVSYNFLLSSFSRWWWGTLWTFSIIPPLKFFQINYKIALCQLLGLVQVSQVIPQLPRFHLSPSFNKESNNAIDSGWRSELPSTQGAGLWAVKVLPNWLQVCGESLVEDGDHLLRWPQWITDGFWGHWNLESTIVYKTQS